MFPWKDFFDGTDQENAKAPGGKGQIRIFFFKSKKERMEERKRRDFYLFLNVREGSCTHVFSIGGEHSQANYRPHVTLTPSGEPIHMGTSPTT